MIPFVHRYGLAIACVAAPFLFGLWPSSVTVAWLMAPGRLERMQLDYRLRDQPAAGAQGRALPSGRPRSRLPRARATPRSPTRRRASSWSRSISPGWSNSGLTSGFLYFVCAGALAVSGRDSFAGASASRTLALAIAGFAVVGMSESWLVMADKQRRLLVTEQHPATRRRARSAEGSAGRGRMVELLAFNLFVGLFPSGWC